MLGTRARNPRSALRLDVDHEEVRGDLELAIDDLDHGTALAVEVRIVDVLHQTRCQRRLQRERLRVAANNDSRVILPLT